MGAQGPLQIAQGVQYMQKPGDRLGCPWTGLGYGSLLILLEFPPDGHQNGDPMPPWYLHSGVAPQLSIKSDGEPAH